MFLCLLVSCRLHWWIRDNWWSQSWEDCCQPHRQTQQGRICLPEFSSLRSCLNENFFFIQCLSAPFLKELLVKKAVFVESVSIRVAWILSVKRLVNLSRFIMIWVTNYISFKLNMQDTLSGKSACKCCVFLSLQRLSGYLVLSQFLWCLSNLEDLS